ncbi:MAG: hypothetical protein ABI665_12990 [Vicinamibacterales bacterium]
MAETASFLMLRCQTPDTTGPKIGRAVYYMLSRGTVFSMDKFLAGWREGSG